MIQHVVLFRLKPTATPGAIVEARTALLGMKDEVAEIREIHFGPNLGPSAQEWSHVLIVSCDDMGALQRYLDHPVHRQTVGQFIGPIREARLAVDVEVQ